MRAHTPSTWSANAFVEGKTNELGKHYTFDNFVEGKSNRRHPGRTNPGRAFNPLLLYGGTGLGKTHLMFAAGNLMRKNNPGCACSTCAPNSSRAMIRKRCSTRRWTSSSGFQQVDALLIDDIQFFAGKDRTQEEFFHTFNALFDGKQQIILTCDRYPKEVDESGAAAEVAPGWGLSVAIEPPDFETRAPSCCSKAANKGIVSLPEDVAFSDRQAHAFQRARPRGRLNT
jgi:chromosomal replication initiator protein